MLIFAPFLEWRNDLNSKSGEGPSDQHGMVHVAIAPPKTLDEEIVKRVASLVGKEIIDTRLLLSGEIPRIIAAYSDSNAATSIVQSLRDAGLVAFSFGDSELRNRPAGFVAHTAKSGAGEVTFRDRRGGEARVEAGDAFLLLRGRIRRPPQEKVAATKMKLNVPATVLAGGIPIVRRVAKKTDIESFQVEDFVRIFDRRSSDPCVEIFQTHMDYAFLGPERTPTAPENFKILVTKLREWFPLAIFDERLTRHYKTDVPAAGPSEALEINCKLIYLCHLAMEERG